MAKVFGGLAVSAHGKLTLLFFSQLTQIYCLPPAPQCTCKMLPKYCEIDQICEQNQQVRICENTRNLQLI